MAVKRLAVWVVQVLMFVSIARAQDSGHMAEVNELAVTVGRSFVSTQTVPSTGLPIHFGSPASFAFNYSRLLKSDRFFGIHAELPAAIYPRMNLNYRDDVIPKNAGALFITPSLRVSILSGTTISPWVSAGGGFGRFWQSSTLVWGGTNPGPTAPVPA